jgi:hypothetical protein
MNALLEKTFGRRAPGASLLGLAFDGSRLDLVALRRTNGAAHIVQSLSVALALDPLANEPELVGREIRKHLDAAGLRERRCAVCLPLTWALTLSIRLPDLPEDDLASFIQLEAERGFPYSPEALLIAQSRYRTPTGESYATLVALPRDHVARLEAALRAAQLRPVSLSLGPAALQPPEASGSEGLLAVVPGQQRLGFLVTCGGGLAALRTVDSIFEGDEHEEQLQIGAVLRELRVTLGQLPTDVREHLRRVRVYGRSDLSDQLVAQLGRSAEALGLRLEWIRDYAPAEFDIQLPPGTAVSGAASLALRHLTGRGATLEFLRPQPTAWQQFAARYSSRKLVSAGVTAGALAFVIALLFLIQEWQLMRWRSRWAAVKVPVTELEAVQQQTKKFRPWFDDSCRSLSILRRLAEAYPEEGTVSAKTVEFRSPATVSCSGTARDNQALLRTLDKLRAAPEITAVQVEQIRGRSPIQFTFNFRWTAPENP